MSRNPRVGPKNVVRLVESAPVQQSETNHKTLTLVESDAHELRSFLADTNIPCYTSRNSAGLVALDQRKYWIGFNKVSGVGPVKLRRLLDYFGDLETAWRAGAADLREAGLDARAIENMQVVRNRTSLDAEVEELDHQRVKILTWNDETYPRLLAHIDDPPPVLYVKGHLCDKDDWAVAVVGTRTPTSYGREVACRLSGDLAANGMTVVSGLARGIDTQAHKGALEAGGRSIAVLGCGVDITYPAENRRLADAIAENGCIVSEFALHTQPEGPNFPARNRIISGLSLGTIVAEAGLRSGALITAQFALEQGRDVFAVPGSIFARTTEGCHRLIQQGAKLVVSCQDILEELNLTMVTQHMEAKEIIPENSAEEMLLKVLSAEPIHVDEITQASNLPIAQVSSTLVMMELKGMIRQVGGMTYVLAR
jgi:DNA processing protein